MEYMRDQKVLHKKYLWKLLFRLKEVLKKLDSLVEVEIPAYYTASYLEISYLICMPEREKSLSVVTLMGNTTIS